MQKVNWIIKEDSINKNLFIIIMLFLFILIIVILYFFTQFKKIEGFRSSDKLFYSPRFEISNDTMNIILDKIKTKSKKYDLVEFKKRKQLTYDYYSGFTGKYLEPSLINNIIIHFLNTLNREILRGKYDNYFFPLFFLIQYFFINHFTGGDLNRIHLVIDIYRIDKFSGFRLFIDIILDKKDIIIYKSNIVDIIKEQDIKINTNRKPPSGKIMTSIPEQIDFLNKKLLKEKEILVDNSFQCINGKGNDLYDCQSHLNINGEPKKKGLWDRPCLSDKECPFYKSNKNYDNYYGGCVKGTCEMPLGISNVGFHFYSNLEKAICHNCKSNSKHCCKEQTNNKIYPNLKSPDYAFKNDKRNI